MLLYTKELVAPPSRFRQGLLRFQRHPLRDKYGRMLRGSFAYSTIHGMQHAFAEDHLFVRSFWLIIVLAATLGFLSMYSILEHRHNEQLLVTTVETTQLSVYNIEFPAVAICPWNHVNWLRAATAAKRFLPSNADQYTLESFHQLLIAMENMTFGKFETLGALSKRNLSALALLNLPKLASYLAYRCDELFVPDSCVFDETSFDCCHLFVQERTDKGHCMVFNSLISDDSRKKKLVNGFYPYKLSAAGEGSGLQFTLRMNKSLIRAGSEVPFAMNLMIKDPLNWMRTLVYHLYPNTENFVAINPLMITTSTNTYTLTPTQRDCYFPHERHPYFPYSVLPYSWSNCVACCMQAYVVRHCRCSLPQYLPPLEGSRECGVLDFECLFSNTDIFDYVKTSGQEKYINDSRRGQYCSCPGRCNSNQFHTLLNVRQLSYANGTNTTFTEKLIRTQVYYGERVITKIETKLKYTMHDWLASFGGILCLYVGASALTVPELGFVLGKILWSLLKDCYAKISSK